MKEIIIELSKISVPIIILYLKLWFDNKKTRNVEQQNTDYRIGVFNKLELKIDKIYNDLKLHVSKDNDNDKIRQAILDKSFDIISVNSDLSQRIKFLLISGQRALIDFAIEYYNSTYRNNKIDKLEYLKIVTDSINDDLKIVALNQFTHIKKVNGKDLDFIEFIKTETKIYIIIQIFIQTLVKNGLKHKEYVEVCENFLKEAFIEGIEGWRKWNRI